MSIFNYVAKDETGRVVQSSIEAYSRHEAIASLRGDGLTVVDLLENTDSKAAPPPLPRTKAAPRIVKSGRVKISDLSVFCRQLAISVNSGVPLRDSLESIAEDMETPRFRHVLQEVVRDLHDGKPFSQAIAEKSSVFSPLFIALIRSAEESGSLPQTLNQLAKYLEKSDRLTRKIKTIAAYPLFVGVFFGLVCLVMTLFVIPQFQKTFEGLSINLPRLTVIVFGTNQYIMTHLPFIIAIVFIIVAAFALFRRTDTGRYQIDRFKLKLPFFGTILRKYAIARFCRNLAMMLSGGVAITTAMKITSAVSGNKILEQTLMKARERVITGSSIASSLSHEQELPSLVIRMISVGENSGRLPEVLENVADVYEDQVEAAILTATSLFEPLAIVFFGAIILVLVMAIYFPVFTMGSGIQ
ncbi:MAG: type II secretion system F family protein [Verrucomicrobia bacterium]|nr:type II secretion system F family protein [Verrucomicrobiota bacterium]